MIAPLSRRKFLELSVAAAAGASATTIGLSRAATVQPSNAPPEDVSIGELQAAMERGELTSLALTRTYLERIERLDWDGPRLNSVIEVDPDVEAKARELDAERAAGRIRGPLHGIPIVLKDCIATADRMQTTAGSLALVGSKVAGDAGVVTRLRESGALLLGKANMSEWSAFRGWPLHGGWSGRAGIGRNPYALAFSTGDSSSGSAAVASANLAAGAVGMETYGSIVMPSSLCGVVGLKPTYGLVSRSRTIGISFSRDVVGPIGRTVEDVATMLGAMAGEDPLDPITRTARDRAHADYRRFLSSDGLRGVRIGVWRPKHLWKHKDVARAIEGVLPALRDLGATLVDPVELPDWMEATGEHVGVMFTEFRHEIDRYLAGLRSSPVRTLAEVVAFNEAHAEAELRWHSQNTLESALEQPPLSDPSYGRSLRRSRRLGRHAIDNTMRQHRLDAIVAPTFVRPWLIDLLGGDDPENGNGAAGPSNAAGYPHLTVPAGFVGELPVGLSFMASAWEEPKLLRLGHAFERAVSARRPPRFLRGWGVEEFVSR
jgi:amidase